MATALGNRSEQAAAYGVLAYVSDLVTASPRESFSRVDVLVLLNCVQNDRLLFEPEVGIAYGETEEELRG
jgi:hypothetical protein